jgi:hypothetical protein
VKIEDFGPILVVVLLRERGREMREGLLSFSASKK